MNIMLGNMSVSDIEKRIGIEFPEEIREFMRETNQENASKVEKGKWHCYDIPFSIVCGDMEIATKIFNFLIQSKVGDLNARFHYNFVYRRIK